MNLKSKVAANGFTQNEIISNEYSRGTQILFFVFAIYLVLPIIDIPLLGLSISAPIFFVIALTCILRAPKPWFSKYRLWIIYAMLIWAGIFTSAMSNGLISGGIAIDNEGVFTIIRFAYWLLTFVITSYFASQGKVAERLSGLLGWAILLLALLRWGEVAVYNNIGAWTGTYLLSQNDYGLLLSIFSPFLLIFLLQARGIRRIFAIAANMIVWTVALINGSRGSWVAMASGLGIALFILVRMFPRKFMGLFIGALLVSSISALLLLGVPSLSAAVTTRLDSFQNLDSEKSYMIRQLMNQKATLLFEESPLIGIGAARFQLASIPLEIPQVLSYASQAHFDRKSSHNSYLGFLAENGLVGGIPFAVLLVVLFVQSYKVQSYFLRKNEYWALAIFLSFIQMSIHMWVISSLTNTVTWFIYGLVGALIMSSESNRS